MKIPEIYKLLCDIYGVSEPLDIRHFLIMSEGPGCDSIIGSRFAGREALLIRQSEDDLELGLFISPSIISALECRDALGHLDELACAIEGCSHFLYVADRAEKERQISALELELQGEVDKFLIIHLIAAQELCDISPSLFAKQFESHSYDPNLSPDEIDRYATANHFAAKYCAQLRSRYFNPLRLTELIPTARDFFERGMSAKLEKLIP